MTLRQAKELARQWVIEEAADEPTFRGAFLHGSVNWLADDDALPATSDLDIMVVHAAPGPPKKPGKFRYRGVLLEVSYLSSDELHSPDLVLGQYRLAGSFRAPSIILDPTGRLTSVQAAVAKDYAKRRWVYRRCENARDNVLRCLDTLVESAPFHDQVTAWLFATCATTHILLVAGLRNPTVRRRYLAVQELLADYDSLDDYDFLLGLLGCSNISRTQAERHLAALASAFDAASAVIRTPFFFALDLSELARPIAIDGSRELIAGGHHREAVFWLIATYARCQQVLYHDAPAALRQRFHPGFRSLLADLGITSAADLQRRGEQVRDALPRVWAMAEAIIAANPDIEDS